MVTAGKITEVDFRSPPASSRVHVLTEHPRARMLGPLGGHARTGKGKILSDLILTGKTGLIEGSTLDPARFVEGRMIHETAVL